MGKIGETRSGVGGEDEGERHQAARLDERRNA